MSTVEINLDQITENLDAIKQQKARLSFELKELEKLEEKEELKLIALLGQYDVKTMTYGVYEFGLKEVTRKAFDQKLFGQKHPELLEEFKTEKVTEKFEFKINK